MKNYKYNIHINKNIPGIYKEYNFYLITTNEKMTVRLIHKKDNAIPDGYIYIDYIPPNPTEKPTILVKYDSNGQYSYIRGGSSQVKNKNATGYHIFDGKYLYFNPQGTEQAMNYILRNLLNKIRRDISNPFETDHFHSEYILQSKK